MAETSQILKSKLTNTRPAGRAFFGEKTTTCAMKKTIYSRTITQVGGGQFIDRIQVEEIDGALYVTAYSKIHTRGELESCTPIKADAIVINLINGKGQVPYIQES